jgi:hypothetical protein
MKTHYFSLILAISPMAAANGSETILNTVGDFNYFDWAGSGASEARYTEPTAGVFEAVPGGVLFRANRYRGGGTIISKATYYLPGGSAEFVWSGGGGNSFMQPVCGTFTKNWPTEPGNADASMVIATYGNSWNGSWVATPGRVYKTTVSFTVNSYTASTRDFLTDQYMGGTSGTFDFTKPVHLYLRTGDTFDYQNAYLQLKSLKINGDLATPLPPQKVFLAFDQPSSFKLIIVPLAFGRSWPIVQPFSTMPAATVDATYRASVTAQVKSVFSRSGVNNIDWVTSDSDDAVAVYFCPLINPDILGYSRGAPDRFNSKRRGEVIVFVNESSPLANLDAESAAHEVGHSLGLRHVDPSSADPLNNEAMDLDFSSDPQFTNTISDITDVTSFATHNPRYHLLRYIDGWSPTQLQNEGIAPGTWDSGTSIFTKLSFQGTNLRLHNITLYAAGADVESTFVLEQISSATLSELSQRSFTIPKGMTVTLLASSEEGGSPNVISATGDPFVAENQHVAVDAATTQFSLYRQDSPTVAVPIASATAESDLATPYCNLSLTPPNILRLDFRGTLQQSSNLSDWSDIGLGTTSPHFVVIPPGQGTRFFRSKQPATP